MACCLAPKFRWVDSEPSTIALKKNYRKFNNGTRQEINSTQVRVRGKRIRAYVCANCGKKDR